MKVFIVIILALLFTSAFAPLPTYCIDDKDLQPIIIDIFSYCSSGIGTTYCRAKIKVCHDYKPHDCCKCFLSDAIRLVCKSFD